VGSFLGLERLLYGMHRMRGFKSVFTRARKLSLEVCIGPLLSTNWGFSISIKLAFFGAVIIDYVGGDRWVAGDDDNSAL
jgi:hypothetical protein